MNDGAVTTTSLVHAVGAVVCGVMMVLRDGFMGLVSCLLGSSDSMRAGNSVSPDGHTSR